MREGTISALLYTAAYLAALTISNGWRLVSFDNVFKHFGALQRLTLRSGGSSDQPTLIQLSDGLTEIGTINTASALDIELLAEASRAGRLNKGNNAHPQVKVISLDQSTAEPVLLHRRIESSNAYQS